MDMTRQRKLKARENRQASFALRYGPSSITQVPAPKEMVKNKEPVAVKEVKKEVITVPEKRGRGRPRKSEIVEKKQVKGAVKKQTNKKLGSKGRK